MRVCIYCEISKHKYTQNVSMIKGFQVSRLYPLVFFDKCVSTDRYPKENMCITNILQKKHLITNEKVVAHMHTLE